MKGRRRFARKRKTKRRKKRMSAGQKLVGQMQGIQQNRMFRFTNIYPIQTAPQPGGGANPAALYNFCLLNTGSTTAQSYFINVTPNTVQLNAQSRIKALYQEFTITGLRIKLMFSRESNNNLPASVEWAYDENAQLADGVAPTAVALPLYNNYTAQAIPSSGMVSRYISLAGIKKRLGIGYNDSTDLNLTYYGQLAQATTPSLYCRVTASGGFAVPQGTTIGVMTITYYAKFRGLDFGTNP